MSNANLTGPLPSISSMQSLQELRLDNNQFTGSVPSTLPNSPQQLVLANNKLTGSLATLVSTDPGSSALMRLDLAGNDLYGPLPADLGLHPNIKYINLQANRLNGSLPSSVSCWRCPAPLLCSSSGCCPVIALLSGFVFLDVLKASHPFLRQQRVSSVRIVLLISRQCKAIPQSAACICCSYALPFSCHVVFCDVQWGTLTSLETLDVSSNHLSGSLPNEWSSLTQLIELWLSNNTFMVRLKPTFCQRMVLSYEAVRD